ncbi:hypothetical protein FB561_3697 [Kribbella amoyensis]|uniref:Uncharacterized protein n=1 Tax=Kribbella amoyensis TaxID=996641 RepID=A0A561BUH9_9ACTN|nr:hypothetical protein [Kribbella amoyensis]TWD82564.1 hypothetical protein FB561_3697 [Kribbella amoyensis]
MVFRVLAIGVVVPALLLTACSSTDDPKEASTPVSAPSTLPKLPPVTHPSPKVPRDRDLARVFASLTALDACALLAPGRAKVPGLRTAKLRRTAPHRCEVEGKVGAGRNVLIRAWPAVSNSWSQRFPMATAKFGGVRIYQVATESTCRVFVPVSFAYSIAIFGRSSSAGKEASCRETEAFAAAAIPVLAKASTPTRGRPAGWSGCTALSAILGQPIGSVEMFDGVDDCRKAGVGLGLIYDSAPEYDGKDEVVRIGGRQVELTGGGDQLCVATWSEGSSGQPAPYENLLVSLSAANCAEAKRWTQKARTVLAGPARKGPAPQYPIYLRADEPHSDKPGGCAELDDVTGNQHCLPYVPVEAPKGGQEVLRHVRADRNVLCAISVAAVRRRFGAELQPMTTLPENPPGQLGTCTYLEPTRAFAITVEVGDQPVLGTRPTPTTVKLAGRDAVIVSDPDGERARLELTSADGAFLRLTFQTFPPRGTDGPPDTARIEQLQPFAEEIAGQYF